LNSSMSAHRNANLLDIIILLFNRTGLVTTQTFQIIQHPM